MLTVYKECGKHVNYGPINTYLIGYNFLKSCPSYGHKRGNYISLKTTHCMLIIKKVGNPVHPMLECAERQDLARRLVGRRRRDGVFFT